MPYYTLAGLALPSLTDISGDRGFGGGQLASMCALIVEDGTL